MKTTVIFISLLLCSPITSAKMFKCEADNKTTYQQKPCKTAGIEIFLKHDISQEEQEAAAANLKAQINEREIRKKERQDTEERARLIESQEDRASAAYQNAREARNLRDEVSRLNDSIEE